MSAQLILVGIELTLLWLSADRLTFSPNAQVTGANGFLGSHIVHQLLEKGYRVRGYVDPCYS